MARTVRAGLGCADVTGEKLALASFSKRLADDGVPSDEIDSFVQTALSFVQGSSAVADAPALPALLDGPVAEPPDDRDEVPRAAPLSFPPGTRVVSISRKAGFRRLHEVGRCWRLPGRDYELFEQVSQAGPEHYDAICKDCWPSEAPPAVSGAEVVSEVGSSSESSSTESSSPTR